MKMRVIAAAVLTAATVTACGSSGGSGNPTGSPAGGSPTGAGQTGASGNFCQHLSTAVHKMAGLASAISNPQQLKTKLDPVVSDLQAAKAEAPATISKSIDDLLSAMQGAQSVINGGNTQALMQKMQTLGPKLQNDAAALGRYLAKNCHGGG